MRGKKIDIRGVVERNEGRYAKYQSFTEALGSFDTFVQCTVV